LWRGIEPCLFEALDKLLQMRAREGSALRADLQGHVESLRALVDEIAELVGAEPEQRARRLRERVERLFAEASASVAAAADETLRARLAQEIALLADRGDVSEELARLQSHLAQLGEMLDAEDAVGRRLEFMLQEVNRELNTIASKSSEARVSALVVDGKGVLEKMREQAQNVE